MKRFLAVILVAISAFSCKEEVKFENADNAFDAGRSYIEGVLKGEFKQARFYMLADEKNNVLIQEKESFYQHQNADFRVNYRQASIIIENEATINDSLHLLHYKNSYDKKSDSIYVVKHNNVWLADPSK